MYDVTIDDSFFNLNQNTSQVPQEEVSENITIEESFTAQKQTLSWNEEKYLRITPEEVNVPRSLLFDEHAEEFSFPAIYLALISQSTNVISIVNVALYHIHHIWHYRVRLRESGQPIGRLRKTCKNAFPRTIPVSFGRLDAPIATESSLNVHFF
ncbi:ATP-dependent DNA helicase [Trichonephila clavipes]|nr:ATP-dependent DNA helicase [Trichonephila clavipes]